MFRQMLRSITKIFRPEQWFKQIPQTFSDSPYPTRELAVFWWVGCLLRVRSAEQLEDGIRHGYFRRFGPDRPSADTLRRHLAAVPAAVWHGMLQATARKWARNRAWDRIGGWRVVALDGVELFRSHAATCAECLHREVQGRTEWFHRVVVASVVGPRRQGALEWEPIHPADGSEKNEGESTAAYRLLDRLYRAYHHQIEVLVVDALYCTRVFLQRAARYGWWVVVRLKDDRLTIWQDAHGLLTHGAPVVDRQNGGEHLQIWEVGDLEWETVHGLRVIRWVRTVTQRHRVQRRWVRAEHRWTGTALTTAGAAVSAETVYEIMHHRWDVENCLFRREKTEWDFDHCFGHAPGIVEGVVGMQLMAVSVWKWWISQQTRSAQTRRMPLIRWVEHAWVDCVRMRTMWLAWWAP